MTFLAALRKDIVDKLIITPMELEKLSDELKKDEHMLFSVTRSMMKDGLLKESRNLILSVTKKRALKELNERNNPESIKEVVPSCDKAGCSIFCDNKDVRLVQLRSRVTNTEGPNEFKGEVVLMCAECRKTNRGSVKFVTETPTNKAV